MNIEEYRFLQQFSVNFPNKDIISEKMLNRGQNGTKTQYLNCNILQNLQQGNTLLTNDNIPWESIQQNTLENNQQKVMNRNFTLYETIPNILLNKKQTDQRLTGIFIEPKQIAKNEDEMNNFIQLIYGKNPKQKLNDYVVNLQQIVLNLQKERNEIYHTQQQFQRQEENSQQSKLFKIQQQLKQEDQNITPDQFQDLKNETCIFLENISSQYNPVHHKFTNNQIFIENMKENNIQVYRRYQNNENIIQELSDNMDLMIKKGANTWNQNRRFLNYLKNMQNLIKTKRLNTLKKLFKRPVSYFQKIKKFDSNYWKPDEFYYYINRKGKTRSKLKLQKRSYKSFITDKQKQVIHRELDNIEQIKGQVKKTNKDILCQLRKQGIQDSQNIDGIQKSMQLSYSSAYRAVRNCNFVQLRSSYVIQDKADLYQIHIKERLVYCTFISLLASTELNISCLDEAYAHLDNGKQQMLGKKGKRVKWPQSDLQDKIGFLLSIDINKQQGIQLIKNTSYTSYDIVEFLDSNNQSLQNISNHIFIMDNATSHVSAYTKRRILQSGMMVLCNASRFPEGNPVEIIIGLMKREIPRYGLNITNAHMSESIIRSFRYIKKTWLIGAYISAYQNCIQFLQDIQKCGYFDID